MGLLVLGDRFLRRLHAALCILGLMGMTRRMQHTSTDPSWEPMLWVAGVGALIILAGIVFSDHPAGGSQLEPAIKGATCLAIPWDGRSPSNGRRPSPAALV